MDNGRAGSDDLEVVFEARLKKVGRVVALLDVWEAPVYLTRIWTIFEQYVASQQEIPVEVILPEDQDRDLMNQLRQGEIGIIRVKEQLSMVSSEAAEAFDPRDEEKVKRIPSGNV